ncbi:MAG: Flp family type IVb pilin [Actinobacteria bacterium]|nr:Flp family type IVb pilin [Actinomycetota bacterium]
MKRAGALPLQLWLQLTNRHSERGANLVEYALLIALIALVAFAAVASLGNTLPGEFSSATEPLNRP